MKSTLDLIVNAAELEEISVMLGAGKRKIVDANDTKSEMANPKKRIIEAGNVLQKSVFYFIGEAHTAIHKKIMGDKDKDMQNINDGIRINEVVFAAYSTSKRSAIKSIRTMVEKEEIDTAGEEIQTTLKEIAQKNGLEFKKFSDGDPADWYWIADLMFSYLISFGLKMEELFLGHSTIGGGKKELAEVREYGLSGVHHILLEGISFPPEKRAMMMKNLGEMTVLLSYMESVDKRSREKWLAAAKEIFVAIPNIDSILELVGQIPADSHVPLLCQELIRNLGNLYLLISSGRTRAMCPPPNVFAKIFGQSKFKIGDKEFLRNEIADVFEVSGHGAFYFYNLMSQMKLKMDRQMLASEAGQITYHSMFSTFSEDLSILEQITEENRWFTRTELRNNRNKPKVSGTETTTFTPIKQIYWSELYSADKASTFNQFKPNWTVPTENFHEDYWAETEDGFDLVGINFHIQYLRAVLKNFCEKLRAEGSKMTIGDSPCFKTEALTLTGSGDAVFITFEGTNKFFMV